MPKTKFKRTMKRSEVPPGFNGSEARYVANLKKREAKDKFLSLVAQGDLTLAQCVKAVGRSYRCYEVWRADDPHFARKVDLARSRNNDPRVPGIDFVKFRSVYFDRDTPSHHLQMIEAMTNAPPDSVTLVLAPPEAAKTSLLVDWVCYQLGPVDPNFRIAVISEGQDLARKIIGQVKTRMTDRSQHSAYIDAYGPFKAPDREEARAWNADFLTVLRSRHDEKEPSLEARGAGSTLYGGRYDLVAIDDIQSDRNLGATRSLLTYIRQTVLTRPAKGVGRTVIFGSRVGIGDIYEAMLEEDMVDHLVQIPALTKPLTRDEHYAKIHTTTGPEIHVNEPAQAESYWPEWWSMLDLARRRDKVGPEVWNRVYMQRPADSALLTFTESLIRPALDLRRSTDDERVPSPTGVMGVDPAIGGWAGLITAAYSSERLWVCDAENIAGLSRTEELLEVIAAFATRWKPQTCVVEVDGYGKGLAADDRFQRLADRLRFTIVPHTTRRNKADPSLGVAMMASSFSEREVSIPWADDSSRHRMAQLVSELRRWRADIPPRLLRQDLVMALWFVWRWWEQERQTLDVTPPPAWRPSWLTEGVA